MYEEVNIFENSVNSSFSETKSYKTTFVAEILSTISLVFKIFFPPQEVNIETTSKSEIIERNILFIRLHHLFGYFTTICKKMQIYIPNSKFLITVGDL